MATFKPGKILARIEGALDWHLRHPEAFAELRGILTDIREGFAAIADIAGRVKRPASRSVVDDFEAPDANGETEAQFEARIAAERKPAHAAAALRDGIELPTRQPGKRITARQQRERAAGGAT